MKVTVGHGTLYSEIEQRRGFEAARTYAEANVAGFEQILELVRTLDIDYMLEHGEGLRSLDQQVHGLVGPLDAPVRSWARIWGHPPAQQLDQFLRLISPTDVADRFETADPGGLSQAEHV